MYIVFLNKYVYIYYIRRYMIDQCHCIYQCDYILYLYIYIYRFLEYDVYIIDVFHLCYAYIMHINLFMCMQMYTTLCAFAFVNVYVCVERLLLLFVCVFKQLYHAHAHIDVKADCMCKCVCMCNVSERYICACISINQVDILTYFVWTQLSGTINPQTVFFPERRIHDHLWSVVSATLARHQA